MVVELAGLSAECAHVCAHAHTGGLLPAQPSNCSEMRGLTYFPVLKHTDKAPQSLPNLRKAE